MAHGQALDARAGGIGGHGLGDQPVAHHTQQPAPCTHPQVALPPVGQGGDVGIGQAFLQGQRTERMPVVSADAPQCAHPQEAVGVLRDGPYLALGQPIARGELQEAVLLGPGLLVALASGVAGGLFARLMIASLTGSPQRLNRWRARWPVRFAAAGGLLIAVIGLATGGVTFGAAAGSACKMRVTRSARSLVIEVRTPSPRVMPVRLPPALHS